MMFIWVLDSRPELERYLDVMYSRLCGLRLFKRFSKVYYTHSLDKEIKEYVFKLFKESSLHEFEELDISEVSSISLDQDILIVTTSGKLDALLSGLNRFLEFDVPAILIVSFEDGYPMLYGLLTIDLFRFIEI